MKKIGGINKITINGTEYGLMPGLEYSLATHTKETKVSQSQVGVGYIEKDFRLQYIKGTLVLGNTPSDFLAKLTSISCEVVYGDVVLIGSDGVDTSEQVLKTDDGTMEFKIEFTSLVIA